MSETQPLSRLDIMRWRADKDDAGKRERHGYVVWLVVGIVIAVPEFWAAIGQPPWPTISATIGHLEALQNLVAIVVVALIVAVAVHSAGYRRRHPGEFVTSSGRLRGRTAGGRLTMHPDQVSDVSAYAYFLPAVGAVVAGTGLAYAANGSNWILAYVLYGLIAVCCLVIPNVLAFWFAREVPFRLSSVRSPTSSAAGTRWPSSSRQAWLSCSSTWRFIHGQTSFPASRCSHRRRCLPGWPGPWRASPPSAGCT